LLTFSLARWSRQTKAMGTLRLLAIILEIFRGNSSTTVLNECFLLTLSSVLVSATFSSSSSPTISCLDKHSTIIHASLVLGTPYTRNKTRSFNKSDWMMMMMRICASRLVERVRKLVGISDNILSRYLFVQLKLTSATIWNIYLIWIKLSLNWSIHHPLFSICHRSKFRRAISFWWMGNLLFTKTTFVISVFWYLPQSHLLEAQSILTTLKTWAFWYPFFSPS